MQTTTNPGYYNNTSCSPGTVTMPNSSLNPITLVPSCNPIDKELINSIISYLISNDIFILNQLTDTQQTPGLFNIYSYGKAYNFLAKNFTLLDSSGINNTSLTMRNHLNNSLNYYGALLSSVDDFIIDTKNMVVDAQLILRTDYPSTLKDVILTIDSSGIVNQTQLSDIKTMVPTLQEVTTAGNSTTHTIVLLNAVTDYELVPYGQMVESIANLLTLNPQIISIILDWLLNYDFSMYIKVDEKATLGGVLTLGLDGKIPFNQIPLLTLQQICDNGHATNTTISALDAASPTDLVTLQQLTGLLSTGIGTLDEVLTLGNTSLLDIELLTTYFTNTIGATRDVYVYTYNDILDTLTITPSYIDFSAVGTGFSNTVSVHVSNLITDMDNRLMVDRSYVVLDTDFGHAPLSGLGIDLDKLDGQHGSYYAPLSLLTNFDLATLDGIDSTGFITHVQFPTDLTGLVNGNVLTFDGINWIPGSGVSGSATLTYFKETLTSTFATWQPFSDTNSLFLKVFTNKNLLFGTTLGSISGQNNFIFAPAGASVAGNYNAAFLATSGSIGGSNNFVVGTTATILTNSNFNFVVNSTSQIGSIMSASYNVIVNSSTHVSSTYQYSGSYSNMFGAINTIFSNTNKGAYSFLLNTTSLTIGGDYITAINVTNSTISSSNNTLINGSDCAISGTRTFMSGVGMNLTSYVNAAFGSYGTVETGGSINSVVARDRLFFVGSGTNAGARKNAITVWKSGATQILGALLLGSVDTNETGSPISGMIRNDSSYLQIYRGGAWTDAINRTTDTVWNGTGTTIISGVPPIRTIDRNALTPIVDINHRLDIGDELYAAYSPGFSFTDGEITVPASGMYQINLNARLAFVGAVVGDIVTLRAVINSDDSWTTDNLASFFVRTILEADETASLNLSFLIGLLDTDVLEFQIMLTGTPGATTATVTSVPLGTGISLFKVADRIYN